MASRRSWIDVGVRARLAALPAVGAAPRLRGEGPLVQALAADAERVLLRGIGPGDVAVERHAEVDREA